MKRRVGKFVFEEIKKLIEKPAFTELLLSQIIRLYNELLISVMPISVHTN